MDETPLPKKRFLGMFAGNPQSVMKPNRKSARPQRGFALIVTLTMMVLLTVVALGLLTLSTISLRSSSSGVEQSVARANARMALMLAIGDLQKHAGLDTRVTAKADILDAANPPVMGVWKSWEGTDHELTGSAQGRPISPGNYATKKKDRFLSWLVSGSTTTLPNTTKGPTKAILLGDNSVGSGSAREKLQVHLTPTQLTSGNQKGGFAWWVSGENQKARLPKPYKPSSDDNARWAMNAKSHSVADTKPFRMESLLSDATPASKAISLSQSDFITTPATLKGSQEFFHDLSTSSVGLLTNVATGGWKKDLSLLTENWARVGTSGLPFFRYKPGQDLLATIPVSGNASPDKSLLYPWSSYRGTAANIPIYQHGAVSSWENLKDYVLAYRDKGITTSSTGKSTINPYSVAIDGDAYGFLHKVRVLPVIARIEWLFSHTAGQVASPAGSYEPRLLITPVITMWNPYNVEMAFNSVPLVFTVPKPLPAALQYSVNGVQNANYNSLTAGNLNNSPALSSAASLNYQISTPFSLKPGETKVFSPAATQVAVSTAALDLQPGYRSKGGHYFALKNDAGANIVAPGTATIKANAKFDTTYNDVYVGVGIYLDMKIGGVRHLAYRMVYTPEVASQVYKPATNLATSPSLSVIATAPSPFMTTIFGARMASKTHVAAKGFVQSSPLVNYTAMGGKDVVESTIQKHYGGTNHPVNSPFDYSFKAMTPTDSDLPNSDANNRGFIVTGFTKSNGLSRCVIDELPLRPLQSLAELQNWDLRYENPVPPFSFNIIGNSDATPLLPANAVVNSADAGQSTNLQHDDSYCANHVLFDDWFFSSIAPDPTTFGSTGRTLQKTYTDFVSGTTPLPNRSYVPLAQDAAFGATSASNANTLYSNYAGKPDSWRTVASRLEVEGMFNVNSTSVAAWRALLGHARNQKVPFIKDTGTAWSVDLASQADYPFSRFSIAGDSEARTAGSSGAFPGAAEFSGYRILDEKQLDALATEIVKQVRLRGPFLSLSEFVNRQLSSGDLALAGTIQSALNEIAKSSATNPYATIISTNPNPSSATPAAYGDAEYKFPQAAEGQATYGLPGWTRQADVLRPLAPILTARDDTFTIRAYGDARDKSGNITARATCEAVVVRTRNYLDPSDLAELTGTPAKQINQVYGRRFQVLSVRWLSPSEI